MLKAMQQGVDQHMAELRAQLSEALRLAEAEKTARASAEMAAAIATAKAEEAHALAQQACIRNQTFMLTVSPEPTAADCPDVEFPMGATGEALRADLGRLLRLLTTWQKGGLVEHFTVDDLVGLGG